MLDKQKQLIVATIILGIFLVTPAYSSGHDGDRPTQPPPPPPKESGMYGAGTSGAYGAGTSGAYDNSAYLEGLIVDLDEMNLLGAFTEKLEQLSAVGAIEFEDFSEGLSGGRFIEGFNGGRFSGADRN